MLLWQPLVESGARSQLTESVDQGAALTVVQCLIQSDLQLRPIKHYKPLSTLLLRCVRSLPPETQEHLTHWLHPYLHHHIDHFHPVLDALADTSLTARHLLEQELETLPEAKQTQIRHQLLRFQPIEQHPPLTALDQPSQKFLISFYQQQAAIEPLALERLLQASQCRIREVALLASTDLNQVSEGSLQPDQVFPLFQSIFPGVRVNALLCLTDFTQQGHPLTPKEFTHLCQLLSQEDNQTVSRQFCRLIAIWVRQTGQVPPEVLSTLAEVPERLAQQNLFEGGTARTIVDALKAIAQSEARALDIELTEKIVRNLLQTINIIQIRNSESEMIDLLSAMHRLNPQFLMQVIWKDCPILVNKRWIRNISVIVKTIHRVESQHSALFDQILTADWCIPEIRSTILEVRGG